MARSARTAPASAASSIAGGNAALTRRVTRASRQTGVAVRFSRGRRRYEREGMRVERDALLRAHGADASPTAPRPGRRGSPRGLRAVQGRSRRGPDGGGQLAPLAAKSKATGLGRDAGVGADASCDRWGTAGAGREARSVGPRPAGDAGRVSMLRLDKLSEATTAAICGSSSWRVMPMTLRRLGRAA